MKLFSIPSLLRVFIMNDVEFFQKLFLYLSIWSDFPSGAVVKNLPGNAGNAKRHGFDPCIDPSIGKIPWSKKWQPTSVFLPGKFYEQRRLAGYSLWGHKESGVTEHKHNDMIMWFFFFSLNRMDYSIWLSVKSAIYTQNNFHLVMVYNSHYILLDLIC